MNLQNVLAGIAVADLPASIKWYEHLLGRAPDHMPMAELAEWDFEQGGGLQVFKDAKRAGSSSITIAVTSLDQQLRSLRDLHVAVGGRVINKVVATAKVLDPDGNQIVFSEQRSAQLHS